MAAAGRQGAAPAGARLAPAGMSLSIRPAGPEDGDALWAILQPVFRAGDTYGIDPDIGREAALAFWLAGTAFLAEDAGAALGTFYIKPNHGGGGAHVANAGFATAPQARGRGVARAMRDAALERARAAGYRAMQFNFVVESNAPALRLWREAGFTEIGRIPEGFRAPDGRFSDALILHRRL
jgi:ribosomal protein S18 acetylase RimI-like enzyme